MLITWVNYILLGRGIFRNMKRGLRRV